jgi:hypothetical protein
VRSVGLQSLLIGGVDVGSTFQDSSAILDSGTNVLLVTDEQYAAIKRYVANASRWRRVEQSARGARSAARDTVSRLSLLSSFLPITICGV